MQSAQPSSPAPPAQPAEPSDAVRTFVFMANLYAQEASGDHAASSSPQRVVERLRGSTESQTYIFGITSSPAPLAEVSGLGLPLIASTGQCPELDYVGFVHLSLPLLEETTHAELECVLDVNYLPLPGELPDATTQELTQWIVARGIQLARQLGRNVIQTGTLYPAGPDADTNASSSAAPDADTNAGSGAAADTDPFAPALAQAGFRVKHTETQLMTPVPGESGNSPALFLPPTVTAQVWPDYHIPGALLADVLTLLTTASADSLTGDLRVEPITWTRERLEQARARLRSRGAHTLLVALVESHPETHRDPGRRSLPGNELHPEAHRNPNPRILAMTELGRHAGSDPSVAEWTITVTARERRGEGWALRAKLAALRALAEQWPQVTRTYCSVGVKDPAMNRIYAHLGARELSRTSSWELVV